MFDIANLSELLTPIVRMALSDLEDFTVGADTTNAVGLATRLEAVPQAFVFVVRPTALGTVRAEGAQVKPVGPDAHAWRACIRSDIGEHRGSANEHDHRGDTADEFEPLCHC
jgi:hypothetical protein